MQFCLCIVQSRFGLMGPEAGRRVAGSAGFSWQLLRWPAASLIPFDVPCSECRQNRLTRGALTARLDIIC
jgi:hypothetical protein